MRTRQIVSKAELEKLLKEVQEKGGDTTTIKAKLADIEATGEARAVKIPDNGL